MLLPKYNRIFKRLLTYCLIFCLSISLFGCVTKYDKDDIAKILKENYSLKKVKIDSKTENIEGEDGYTDTLWTIYCKDYDISFHVLDDKYYGMEAVTNSLDDDFADCIFLKYKTVVDDTNFTYELNEYEGLNNVELIADFNNLQQLKQLYEQLTYIKNYFTTLGINDINLGYTISFNNPLREVLSETIISDGGYSGSLSYLDEDFLDSFINSYLRAILDYRFDDIDEFSEQEINDFIASDDYIRRIGILKNNQYQWYEDLIANQYSYGISFATLYEILVKEEFSVTGNKDNYSFTGIDGNVYEISYDYYQDNNFYYLKDNNKIMIDSSQLCHLNQQQIQDITGLELKTERNVFIDKQ